MAELHSNENFPLKVVLFITILHSLFLYATQSTGTARAFAPAQVLPLQGEATPVPPSPLPGSFLAATSLAGTPGVAITDQATASPTPTLTPTPFFYIQIEPRQIARSALDKAIAIVLILLAGWLVATSARFVIVRLARRIHADVQIFFGRLVYFAIWILAFLWILRVFEVEVAPLTAVVGALGLALSLSSQDLFKNFIAGVYLLLERPFIVGDIIQVGEFIGRVEFVDLRTTIMKTEDGKQVILPNTLLMSQIVVKLREMPKPPETNQPGEEPTGEKTG